MTTELLENQVQLSPEETAKAEKFKEEANAFFKSEFGENQF